MTIYVVMGSTGEYSDRTEWPVHAFEDKERAEELVAKAQEEANRIFETRKASFLEGEPIHNPFDPHESRMSYDGTSYFMYEVEYESGGSPHGC